ncbi:MAG: hypothetical protein OXG04_05055 [Acidobacteria bacterium]|nr:hypothetical protein [Acidobacteriota bacterium]
MSRAVALDAVGVLAALVLTSGCASPPQPIGVVRVGLDRHTVPLGASVEATIQFDLAPTLEPLSEDYQVFLQMLDQNEVLLWTTEHDPPVPTTAWQPGQSIRYTQSVRVPAYPYIGPAIVAVGLLSPISGERLALAGDDLGGLAYRVATLTLEPQHESSFVMYDEGWHQVEFDLFDETSWRWSTDRAVLSFRNPGRAATLLLELQGRPSLFDTPQQLTLTVGGRMFDEVTLDSDGPVRLEYEMTAADLGEADDVRIELLVDRTFEPAALDGGAIDTRQLGIRLFDVYVEPLPD